MINFQASACKIIQVDKGYSYHIIFSKYYGKALKVEA